MTFPLASAVSVASVALLALTPHPAPKRGSDVASLVRRCVAAYGGPGAIARMTRAHQEGSVTSILHPGAPGRIARTYERPGRLRVEVGFPGQASEVRILDGTRGWRNGEEASGPRLDAMILQAVRLDLPAVLSARRAEVRDAGSLELEGKRLRVLAIEPAPGLVVEAAIDPASGRILRSRGTSTASGMPLEFVTTYGDFRRVGGVLVAMREENWANGRSTGATVLQVAAFPRSLPAGTFRP